MFSLARNAKCGSNELFPCWMLIAPPWVRLSFPASSSSRKSRRMVTSDEFSLRLNSTR